MPKIIEVPGYGEVEFPDNMSDDQISAAIQQNISQPQQRGAGEQVARGASMIARGLAAPTVGAIGGGALGGPVGALAGSLAVPAADILTAGYNALAPEKYEIGYPSTAVQNLLTKAGMPAPENTIERALVAGGSALGGVGAQLGPLSQLATTATTQTGRNIAQQLSQIPERQLAASLPAGTVSQAVTEKTESPLLGAGAGMLASLPFGIGAQTGAKQPTIAEVKQAAGKQYDIAKLSNLEFKNNAFKQNAVNIQKMLNQEGFDKDLHPNVNAAINRLVKDNAPKTLQNVETLRKVAKGAASSINPDERRLANIMIDKLDEFVENANPNQLAAGKDMKAVEALKDARQLWSQSKKAEILDDIFNSADLRAEANYTQSGMENALRRRLVNLADNKKLMRTFTKQEQQDIINTAKGGSIQNMLRWAGKLSPTSVIPAVGGSYIGASLFGPIGAAAGPLIGAASRYGATRMGLKNFEDLQRRLLTGGQIQPTTTAPSAILGGRGLLNYDMTNDQQ